MPPPDHFEPLPEPEVTYRDDPLAWIEFATACASLAGDNPMSLAPKTIRYPSCYGIACPLHSRCARWYALHNSEPDLNTIGTCLDAMGTGFPEFIEYTPLPTPPQQQGQM